MGTGLIALFLGSTARAEDLFTEGPDDLGLGNGISVADMDGDGWVDIVVPSAMSLWTNRAGEGWVYSDIPLLHGYTAGQYGASLGDYDGDGLPDLVTEPRGGYAELLQNTGGAFELFADGYFAYPPGSQDAETAAWIDADSDGLLDAFVPAYYGRSGFWHQVGDGGPSFEQVAADIGLVFRTDDYIRSEGAQFVDIDRDGDPDLYVCGDLFQNHSTPGAPWFEAQPASGIEPAFDEGAALADVDMDGDFDLAVLYMDHSSSPTDRFAACRSGRTSATAPSRRWTWAAWTTTTTSASTHWKRGSRSPTGTTTATRTWSVQGTAGRLASTKTRCTTASPRRIVTCCACGPYRTATWSRAESRRSSAPRSRSGSRGSLPRYAAANSSRADTATADDSAADSAADTAEPATSRDDSGGSSETRSPEGCGCASAGRTGGGFGLVMLAMGCRVRRSRASGRD